MMTYHEEKQTITIVEKKIELANATDSLLLSGEENQIIWQLWLSDTNLILTITSQRTESPLLHWGVAYEKWTDWVAPPLSIRPPGTRDRGDGMAVQTPMIMDMSRPLSTTPPTPTILTPTAHMSTAPTPTTPPSTASQPTTPMSMPTPISMPTSISAIDGEEDNGQSNPRFCATITIPMSLNIRQIFFVLYFPHSNQWDNNHNQDYVIPLPPDPMVILPLLQREDPHVRLLVGRILGKENKKSWEMGMRLEFIQQLLIDYKPNESVLSLLEIYLQYAAQGYLPWRRHYDRQTYVLAPKILGLALKLSDMVSSYPHLLPFWLRMMKNLPSSSRNLQDIGSAIRHKILECKDHQNRITYDQFVSEFHQKLHNASGPEDIAITKAYLAFMDSQGDLNQFLESLWEAGLAKKEETSEHSPQDGREVITHILDQYGDYRSIHHLPSYVAKKAEATRKVFQELLILLQDFFGGMEIEEAITRVLPQADSLFQKQLQDLLTKKAESETAHSSSVHSPSLHSSSVHSSAVHFSAASLDMLKQLSHLRNQIVARIRNRNRDRFETCPHSHSHSLSASPPSSFLSGEETRDLLHLELVLEDYAKALANALLNDLPGQDNFSAQDNFCGISPEHLDLLQALLSHLSSCCLVDPEIPVILQSLMQWEERMAQWKEIKGHDMDWDWCLQGKAILDRINRIILRQVSSRIAIYQQKAELLGRLLEIEPQAWQIFTEEGLRNDWLFLLSRLVTLIQKKLRQAAGWSATEVLVPGQVQGIVTKANDLSSSSLSSPSPLDAPRIVLLEHLLGDEDIPEKVVGIISRVSRDRMSHFGIRAREQGVVWIYLEEESDYREIEKHEGNWIKLSAIDDHFQCTPCTSYTSVEEPSPTADVASAYASDVAKADATDDHRTDANDDDRVAARDARDVASADASDNTTDDASVEARQGVGERKRVCFPKVHMADSLSFLIPALYEPFTVGPKAYQLRLLKDRLSMSDHVRVPDSITVPFGVFDLVLESNPPIHREYREITTSLANSLAKKPEYGICERLEYLRSLVESLDIDEAYLAALKKAVQERLGHDAPLITRSSSNAEDLEEYSGAGLYESYPGVPLNELPRFLKKVWASKWTERAVKNRFKAGKGAGAGTCADARAGALCDDVHMAVLIQELILADYAFVVHTHHPLTRSREQVYLEIVQGLGESLVGGSEGQGYRFVYDRTLKEVKRVGYASKGYKWVIGDNGLPIKVVADYSKDFLAEGKAEGQSEWKSSERESPERKLLEWKLPERKLPEWKQLIYKIAEIAIKIEASWGNRPQDIEGVIKGNRIFIVQTRPQM